MESITELFKNISNFEEDKSTQELIIKSSQALSRGYLTKAEFLDICIWKSARQKQNYLSNSEEEIKEITKISFECPNEKVKIISLTALNGVSIPTASAILTLVDPNNYGVIDIRVWQVLFHYGLVNNCESGVGFNVNNWIEYLNIIRNFGKEFDISVRTVEQIIFRHHKDKIQQGNLYK